MTNLESFFKYCNLQCTVFIPDSLNIQLDLDLHVLKPNIFLQQVKCWPQVQSCAGVVFFRGWTAPAENNTCNLMQDQPLGEKSQSSLLPLFRVKKCWRPTSPKELLKRQNKPLVKGVCMLWRTYTVDGEALLMGPESATSTIEFLPVAPPDSISSLRCSSSSHILH